MWQQRQHTSPPNTRQRPQLCSAYNKIQYKLAIIRFTLLCVFSPSASTKENWNSIRWCVFSISFGRFSSTILIRPNKNSIRSTHIIFRTRVPRINTLFEIHNNNKSVISSSTTLSIRLFLLVGCVWWRTPDRPSTNCLKNTSDLCKHDAGLCRVVSIVAAVSHIVICTAIFRTCNIRIVQSQMAHALLFLNIFGSALYPVCVCSLFFATNLEMCAFLSSSLHGFTSSFRFAYGCNIFGLAQLRVRHFSHSIIIVYITMSWNRILFICNTAWMCISNIVKQSRSNVMLSIVGGGDGAVVAVKTTIMTTTTTTTSVLCIQIIIL